MIDKRQVVMLLYDALNSVRYPGIAQVDVQNFKSCFLSENNIFSLLRWLYMKGIDEISPTDKTLNFTQGNKDSAADPLTVDEKFLIKWYSQSGIYTSEKAIQGQCQIDAFNNLTDYIINVICSNTKVLPELIAWNAVEKYFANQISFTPLSYNPKKSIQVGHFKSYIEKIKKCDKTENNLDKESMKKELASFTYENESYSTIENQKKKNQPFVFKKFCKNFENDDIGAKIVVENKKSLDTFVIRNTVLKFSSLSKVICAKTELRCNLDPAYVKIENSLFHSVSENIMTQLNNLTKARDAK
ncbi:uncharacterized protein LOC123272713 [Cotesia glomerata]|uniref:uncharacterized protein LOC123272713 n=1 Tax=Cotesia glomerata TaxID=32391 RepID=UPI001D007CD5|nr:uncharacterized protein LOC123272713 [Cotesia glomerata]